ncbi:hypothetical protein Tco_0046873 [Tanacetum coccineum]
MEYASEKVKFQAVLFNPAVQLTVSAVVPLETDGESILREALTMGNYPSLLQMKVFMDKRNNNKVMFAEANEDFLASLYDSALMINVTHFNDKLCKDVLANPVNSSAALCEKYMELRNSFGVEGNDFLWTYVQFELNKSVNLLKDATLDNLPSLFSNSAQPHLTVKILIHKSKKKVLCAEVDNFIMEMLLSFLTIPLGAVKVLTKDTSYLVAINNLYKSISTLGDENYLKSDDIKNMLLSPKLASIYIHVTDLLPIYEKGITQGSFLKEQATFIVSNDLKIELSSFFPTLWLYTHGIPADDIKIVEVSIGEPQVLTILKASLTSTSALTDCLNAFWKNSKAKSTSTLAQILLQTDLFMLLMSY